MPELQPGDSLADGSFYDPEGLIPATQEERDRDLQSTQPFEGATPKAQGVYEDAYGKAKILVHAMEGERKNRVLESELAATKVEAEAHKARAEEYGGMVDEFVDRFHDDRRETKEREAKYDERLKQQIEETERQRYLATHDKLTDLLNKAAFDEAGEALQGADYEIGGGKPPTYALLFIDLNKFKAMNDEHGHAAGDVILRGVAKILKKHTRSSDTTARIGGDEFGVILDRVTGEKALEIAQRICDEAHLSSTSSSIGVRLFDSQEIRRRGWKALLDDADKAMYKAKSEGPSNVVVHSLDQPDS